MMGELRRRLLARDAIWGWLLLAVSLLGFGLRVEHALTFDHVHRASDYNVHLLGVRWMQENWEPFYHSRSVNDQVRSYPPLWYFLSALILELHDNERLLVVLSVSGWVMRQAVLWLLLRRAIPHHPLSRLIALSIHALLPLSVLVDGKINPEGLHSGIFAVALYLLWRVERQSQTPTGVSLVTAGAFGAVAGLALLAKITGGMLVPIAAAVFGLHSLRWSIRDGVRSAWQKLGVPGLIAGAGWCAVAGFWSGRNLIKFGHPFPHVWQLETPSLNLILTEPVLYRRPLGWALPFEWSDLWSVPIIRSTSSPRPNFWATEVIGTWTDIYNRGFCRLLGGPMDDGFWGGRRGHMSQGSSAWDVSQRCVEWFASMAHVGVWLSGAAVLALLWYLWRTLRSLGQRGSLALPLVPLLCTASAMSFALAYPLDDSAVLNPRYLLSQVLPMSACLGLTLAQLETEYARRGPLARLLLAVPWGLLALILVIGGMLIVERFGS
jgi:hypothetical protein